MIEKLAILNEFKVPQKIYACCDAGSTGLRVRLGSETNRLDVALELESEYGEYIKTMKDIVPMSSELKDNLLIELESNVHSGTLLFGKLKDTELCVKKTLNGGNKCLSKETQVTTIVGLATALLEYDNSMDNEHDIYLIPTFRARDLDSPNNIASYKQAMTGKHKIKFPLIDREVVINIKEMNQLTEPAATAINVRANNPIGNQLRNMIIVDGGGSSIDTITVIGADIYESKASNTSSGGDDLKNKFEQVISQTLGFPPTPAQMEEALTSAKITSGSEVYDVSQLNQMLHTALFDIVKKEINKQLQLCEQTIYTIDAIVVTGRLFAKASTHKTVVDMLSELYANVAGLTIVHIEDEHSITKGAACMLPRYYK